MTNWSLLNQLLAESLKKKEWVEPRPHQLWIPPWLWFLEIWLSQMSCNDQAIASKPQIIGKEQPGSTRLHLDASGASRCAELGLRRNRWDTDMMNLKAALKHSRLRNGMVSEIKSVNIWLKNSWYCPTYLGIASTHDCKSLIGHDCPGGPDRP